MLIRLLRRHLAPYKQQLALVVLLQLMQTIATLYLPTLNADIIDNGVVKGDTDYILRIGARDARRLAGADRVLDRRRLLRRAGRHGGSAATSGRPSSTGCKTSRRARSATSGPRR